jgi:phosphatidylglycerophosphate synthase
MAEDAAPRHAGAGRRGVQTFPCSNTEKSQQRPRLRLAEGGLTSAEALPWTVADVITGVRTVAAVVLGVLSLQLHDAALLVAAYAAYWIGDIVDGVVARRMGTERRAGAVLDIVADRACAGLLAVCFLTFRPEMAVPVALFLVQFMLVDCVLSLSFLRWPIRSPNYFYVVHPTIHRLNWSPPAKASNTSALIAVMVVTGSPMLAAGVAGGQLALKVASLAAVARLLTSAATDDGTATTAVAPMLPAQRVTAVPPVTAPAAVTSAVTDPVG